MKKIVLFFSILFLSVAQTTKPLTENQAVVYSTLFTGSAALFGNYVGNKDSWVPTIFYGSLGAITSYILFVSETPFFLKKEVERLLRTISVLVDSDGTGNISVESLIHFLGFKNSTYELACSFDLINQWHEHCLRIKVCLEKIRFHKKYEDFCEQVAFKADNYIKIIMQYKKILSSHPDFAQQTYLYAQQKQLKEMQQLRLEQRFYICCR